VTYDDLSVSTAPVYSPGDALEIVLRFYGDCLEKWNVGDGEGGQDDLSL
jgi:hypothetical protein